jgi:hypothetical protein
VRALCVALQQRQRANRVHRAGLAEYITTTSIVVNPAFSPVSAMDVHNPTGEWAISSGRVQVFTVDGTGLEANSNKLTAVKATGNTGVQASGAVGVDAQGANTGVLAHATFTGVDASGNTAIKAAGINATNTVGVDASGTTAVKATAPTSNQNSIGVQTAGAYGVDASGSRVGVNARSSAGTGVSASTGGSNVAAVSAYADGVNTTGVNSFGDQYGVYSEGKTGIMAKSNSGLGSEFSGAGAPIRLDPATTPGAPSTGTHKRGELYVDSAGNLFLCVADSAGNAGTGRRWSFSHRQSSNSSTAGKCWCASPVSPLWTSKELCYCDHHF